MRDPAASRTAVVLLSSILSIVGIELVGIYVLATSGVAARCIPVSQFTIADHSSLDSAGKFERFAAELKGRGFSSNDPSFEQVIEIQNFIGNSIARVGVYGGRERSYELYRKGVEGLPLACGSMAVLLSDGLTALGYQTRMVRLHWSNFAWKDTHVAVEVLLEGDWILFDPTFNVSFESHGQSLGVAGIRKRLLQNGPSSVTPRYHGDRTYPARLEKYKTDWRPLFGNVYFVGYGNRVWGKWPPFRWWVGPRRYYFGDQPILWAKASNELYFVFVVLIPTLLLLLGSALVITQVRRRHRAIPTAVHSAN